MFYLKLLFGLCFVTFAASEPRKYTLSDEIYNKAPKLFSLDEYDDCFSNHDGVYCMGAFSLSSDEDNLVLNELKKHSQDGRHFNYTKIHRGVCLSQSCSNYKGTNSTHIFEKCVADWISEKYGFQAELEKFYYCKSSEEYRNGLPVDKWDQMYLFIIYVIVALNIIGTLYDTHTRGQENRNNYLLAWSFIYNIKKLLGESTGTDPRVNDLACSYGARIITLTVVMCTHFAYNNFPLYLHEPRYLEELTKKPLAVLMQNGPILVQWFVLLSTMLMTFNILIASESYQQISIKMLPVSIMSRLIRIVPLYYLTFGFVATWWKHVGSGPLWPYLAGRETDACRESIWSNLLFYHNIWISDAKCVFHSWFLATDIQIHILVSILVLSMWKLRPKVVYTTFGLLFVISSVWNSFVSYYLDMKPHLFMADLEYLRVVHNGVRDVFLYVNPTHSMPACFAGIIGAWILYDCKTKKYDLSKNKWFMLAYKCSVPVCYFWVQSGYWVQKHCSTRLLAAIYAGIDKPVFVIILLPFVIGSVCRVNEDIWHFFAWRGWHPLGRSSLAAMLIHWHFYTYMVANKTLLREILWTPFIVECLGSLICVYALAGVLTAAVEYPVKNTFKTFMLSRIKVKSS